ncbi:MAG: NADH-dependent [FeFe] hydrogenase, group A6 [bacterium]
MSNIETKKTLFIDGREVEFSDERNILEVIRKQGLNVPTFCYRPDLSIAGACRMCVVEIEGRGIQSSCTMPPESGLKIKLNTERVRRVRKTVLELLLADHDRECTTCDRSGTCTLQALAEEYGLKEIRYVKKDPKDYLPIDNSNPSIIRDPNKCILCGACVRACQEHQGHAVLGFANRGSKTVVAPMAGRELKDVDCVFCGQCSNVCPTGALTIKSEVDRLWSYINNPEKKVVVQIAPSVRVGLGEAFGMKPGENTIGKIVAALRKIGVDLVFDTNFTADLTIMEEATEFVNRIKNNGVLPMFTSCCPAWVRYLELTHPDMLDHLSTCRSPQGMFGPVIKHILPQQKEGYTKENIVSVSIMPCTAKKAESLRSELAHEGIADVDFVLTTQELARLIKSAGIDFAKLEDEMPDAPYGDYSGAGVIFGASGGVAEAAARTAYEVVTGKVLENPEMKEFRGLQKHKEISLDLNGLNVKVRVVNTLAEAEKSLKEIQEGKADFQLLEVMACPGGCINGGGQPMSCNDSTIKLRRAEGLYKNDSELPIRKSHENPDIKKLYADYLGEPNSHKAHELLHTHYKNRYNNSYKDLK